MKESVVLATGDSDIIGIVSEILVNRDYNLHITKSILQSILSVLTLEVTVFLLDFEHDARSGVQLIRIIRQIRPRLPIIVLSFDSSRDFLQKVAELGIFYHILKPLDYTEIEQVIDAIERIEQKVADC